MPSNSLPKLKLRPSQLHKTQCSPGKPIADQGRSPALSSSHHHLPWAFHSAFSMQDREKWSLTSTLLCSLILRLLNVPRASRPLLLHTPFCRGNCKGCRLFLAFPCSSLPCKWAGNFLFPCLCYSTVFVLFLHLYPTQHFCHSILCFCHTLCPLWRQEYLVLPFFIRLLEPGISGFVKSCQPMCLLPIPENDIFQISFPEGKWALCEGITCLSFLSLSGHLHHPNYPFLWVWPLIVALLLPCLYVWRKKKSQAICIHSHFGHPRVIQLRVEWGGAAVFSAHTGRTLPHGYQWNFTAICSTGVQEARHTSSCNVYVNK